MIPWSCQQCDRDEFESLDSTLRSNRSSSNGSQLPHFSAKCSTTIFVLVVCSSPIHVVDEACLKGTQHPDPHYAEATFPSSPGSDEGVLLLL